MGPSSPSPKKTGFQNVDGARQRQCRRVLFALMIIFMISCDTWKAMEDFFTKPPVTPINRILKTAALAGYGASITAAWMQGLSVPGVTVAMNKSTAIFYADLQTGFPFHFRQDNYQEAIILALKLTEEVSVITILLTESDIGVGNFRITEIRTFPVILHEEELRVVFASNDINIGGGYDLEIQLSPEEIDIELVRAQTEVPVNEYIAIDQNAWIIEVNRNGTLQNLFDDRYELNGGEQSIEVMGGEIPSASTLQMAMIQTILTPSCSKNPLGGYVFMNNIGVSSHLSETVLAQSLMNFPTSCNGKIEIMAAFGNYITSMGKKIPMELGD